MAIIDLAGQRFTRLVANRCVGRIDGGAVWECVCDCGKIINVRSNGLRTGNTKSCGCYHSAATTARNFRHGSGTRANKTPEFKIWCWMRQRCNNPKDPTYPRYGGRGIRVCERWNLFANFIADMGPRPSPDHSIERNDNDGPYSPENCRWATRSEQARNRRSNRHVTVNGVTKLLNDWAKETGIDSRIIQTRMDRGGWTPEKAIATPVRKVSKPRRDFINE